MMFPPTEWMRCPAGPVWLEDWTGVESQKKRRRRVRVSVGEEEWRRGKEGEDYFRVEVPIVCHDGESIQGSHVTQHEATYILQWSHFDRTAGISGGQDMLDMLTHPQHKAKVMYYCEVLNSLDYRGSMTSLQSTQSGFSCISKASGHHSTSGVSSGVSSSLSEAGAPLRLHHGAPVPDDVAS